MNELPGWFADALVDAGVTRSAHTTVGRYLVGDVDPRPWHAA